MSFWALEIVPVFAKKDSGFLYNLKVLNRSIKVLKNKLRDLELFYTTKHIKSGKRFHI